MAVGTLGVELPVSSEAVCVLAHSFVGEIFLLTAGRAVLIRANFPGRIGEKGEFSCDAPAALPVQPEGFEWEKRAAGGRFVHA